MYLTTLLNLTSCVYLITCCLVPEEMMDFSAQFLSIITTLPDDGSYSSIITHVSKSAVLSIRFIVLFTILGVHAVYEIFKKREIIPPKTKKNVMDTPIMQSTAGLTLKSKSEKSTEPMTVTSTAAGDNNNIIKSATTSNQIEPAKSVLTTKPIINNKDMVKNSLSTVVHPTLAQDQLTKDEKLSAISINNNQHVTSSPSLSPIVDQPTMVQPEESIPSLKSDDGEEDEEENNNSVTQDNKESSDVSKEQYYSNMIKKDNNLMSFSDNLQRIFEEPSTPVPLNRPIVVPNNKHYYEDNNRPGSIQTSFEEENVVTTTPALTPTNPTSSTVSRKSSMASQKSTLKGMFSSAFHKSSRKNSIKSHHSSDPQQQQQQQQTMMPEIHDLTASTSTKRLSRLSTFRLGRKKSTASNTSAKHSSPVQSENVPVKPVKEKSSFASNMKNKFKKTGEKIQNIVHKKA